MGRIGAVTDVDYEDLRVDGEYNRHGVNPKQLNKKAIFLDGVVHVRGDDSNNLCVIEFKKSLTKTGWPQKTCAKDLVILKGMTKPCAEGCLGIR